MSTDGASVDGAILEGLVRLLEPAGAFADDLRAAGYDLQRPKLRYPHAVLMGVLDVCARHAYPGSRREEAHRDLGRRFVEHFVQTLLGRVTGTLLQAMGLRRFLLLLPKITSMVSAGLKVEVEQVGAGELRITFNGNRELSPDFTSGALESTARSVRSDLRVEVCGREPEAFTLRVLGTR